MLAGAWTKPATDNSYSPISTETDMARDEPQVGKGLGLLTRVPTLGSILITKLDKTLSQLMQQIAPTALKLSHGQMRAFVRRKGGA